MKSKVKKQIVKGKNIRFSDEAFVLLKSFCEEKGYKLGNFCEIGALDKMRKESTIYLGISDKKIKVFLLSDNYDVSDIVFTDISGCTEWIENDEHEQGEDYEYVIRVAWMTETEIEKLPEAEL